MMIEPTTPQLATAARTFGLLFAPVRLHLVALASCAEYDVGTLAALTGVSVIVAVADPARKLMVLDAEILGVKSVPPRAVAVRV